MSRSATRAGPGTARSPSAHFRTVRSSTSSAFAASRCVMPSAAMASRNSSADIEGGVIGGNASVTGRDGSGEVTFAMQPANCGDLRRPLAVRTAVHGRKPCRDAGSGQRCRHLGQFGVRRLGMAAKGHKATVSGQDDGAGVCVHAGWNRPNGPMQSRGKRMPVGAIRLRGGEA